MDHQLLPFKTLGPLLGLLAVTLGLSVANLSYFNPNTLTADVIATTYSTLTFKTFDLRFDTSTYPYKPFVHWEVYGPASLAVSQSNLCKLSDSTGVNGQPVNVHLNPTVSANEKQYISWGDHTAQRTVTMTCSGGTPAVTVSKSLFYPPDESKSAGDFGDKILITSFTLTPANRPVGSSGTLAWQAIPGSVCTLKKGTVAKTVSFSSANEAGSYLNVVATNPATTYTLTCASDSINASERSTIGYSRATRVIVDTPSTPTSTGTTTSSTGPAITSFSITPNPRYYNQSAVLAWTSQGMNACELNAPYGTMLSRSSANINSAGVPVDKRTIPASATQPSFLGPYNYNLYCFDAKGTVYTKVVAFNTYGSTAPTSTPPTPTSAGGVGPIMPGSDSYSTYNIPGTKPDQNLARVRIAQDIPNFSSSPNKTALSGPLKLLAYLFGAEAEALPVINTFDIYKDGVANYDTRPILKVPYWTKVKFQWRFAERSQNDATADPLRPTNLPGNSWCGYVDSVKKDCAIKYPDTKSKEYDNCLHSRIAWPPQAIVFDSYNKTTQQYNNWKMLYDGGFTSCKDQYSSGEWEWQPKPGDATKTLLQVSQVWAPNGNSPINLNPVWLPKTSDSGTQKYVTVQAYKCERPYKEIETSLYNGQRTDITEDNFRDWAKNDNLDWFGGRNDGTVDSSRQCAANASLKQDPTKCGSGDIQDISSSLFTTQTCTSVPNIYIGDEHISSYTTLDKYISLYSDKGYPFNITYALLRIKDGVYGLGGLHSVIVLKMTKSGSGSSSNYTFDILDPNGPTNDSLTCKTIQSQTKPGVFTKVLVCKSDKKPGYGDIVILNRDVAPSSVNIDSLIASRVRDNVSGWLKNNYPNINNSDPWTNGGVCAGWTDFVLRVAYLGNFIGECPRP